MGLGTHYIIIIRRNNYIFFTIKYFERIFELGHSTTKFAHSACILIIIIMIMLSRLYIGKKVINYSYIIGFRITWSELASQKLFVQQNVLEI